MSVYLGNAEGSFGPDPDFTFTGAESSVSLYATYGWSLAAIGDQEGHDFVASGRSFGLSDTLRQDGRRSE